MAFSGRNGTGSERDARRRGGRGIRRQLGIALVLVLGLLGASPAQSQVVNEDCLAVILNRVTQVNADGFYVIPNIPVPQGLVRARVVCLQDGTTYRGHTEFRQMIANSNTNFGDFVFDDSEPIPVNLILTATGPTTLTPILDTTQLVTTGELVDGTLVDLTPASTGTSYATSNSQIATVGAEGLVTGVSSGNVLVTARNEGQIATIAISVLLDNDSDNDGMPDDYEQLNAVNPGGANLARMNGAVANASSNLSSYVPNRVRDGSVQTSWFTGIGDAANLRSSPWIEIVLPRDIDLAQVRVFGNRQSPDGFDFFAGVFTAYDAGDAEIFYSGEVLLPAPDRDQAVAVDVNGVRRLRFTATDDESNEPGLAEIELIERPGGEGLDENDDTDAALDFDADGLTNLEEFEAGSSPFLIDTDGDRLTDLEEATIGSNPLLPDTDGDGLQDGDELNRTSDTDNDGLINILDSDSDGDSLPDGAEIDIGTSPINTDSNNNGLPDGSEDTDLDNLPNLEELLENTDPADPDTDDDGLLDGEEVVAGDDGFITDPLRPDTDGDGMEDGFESEFGLDPTDPSDAGNDEEPDGLTNLQEFWLGSDPFDPDTTPPGVVSVEPADGTTLEANKVVLVRFNEAMRADTLTPETVTLLLDGDPIEGTVLVSGDNLTATFDPDDTMDVGVFVTVRVQDARDSAGNRMLGVVETEFFTDPPIDTTAPDVISTTPVNNATSVPTNAPFTVQFNERINPATVTTSCLFVIDRVTNQPVAGMVQVDPGGRVASFVPDAPYAVSRDHYGRLNSNCIEDLAENKLPYHNFSFKTAFEEDEDRPALVQTSPADGALAIPVNALIMLEFDEPIGLLGAVAGITVEANGELVPGSIALSGGNRRVTFTSLTALDADTIHTVTVGTEVTDIAGFPVENPVVFSFTTSDTADIVAPAIVGYTPASNATGIGTNTAITIAFSERINPITVNESTFTLTENVQSTGVSGQVVVAPDLMSVTFTPDDPLAPFTSHTRTLTYWGITDYTTKTLSSSNYTRSFTTGSGPDEDPPQVELVGPADGATGVPATTVVTVRVDENLDVLSIADDAVLLLNGAEVVEGSLTRSGRTFTFTPDELLDALTTYTVDVDGFTDVVGNPVVPFVSGFTTGTVPSGNIARAALVEHDVSSTLSSSYLPTRATDGNLNTEWCLGSGDTANSGDTPYYEVVLPGDSNVTEIHFRGRRASNGTEIFAGIFQLFASDGSELWNSGELIMPLPTPRDLDVFTGGVAGVRRVRLTVTQDESNNPCMAELEVVGSYDDPTLGQMVDNGKPSSISMAPANGAVDVPLDSTIVVEFNEPVSPATVTASTLTVKLLDLSGTPTIPGAYAVAGSTVTFTPSLPLAQNQRVRVSVTSSIQDLSGNTSNTSNRTFTTVTEVDDIPPTVLMVTPEEGAADVGRTTPISLTFSEPINPATVNGNTFALFVNGAEVSTTLSRSSDNTVVTLTRSPLEANAYFTVVATSGVKDLSGNPLADFASSFSTVETFDTGRPSIVTVRPGNGATRVAGDTSIVLYANEALDSASVESGLFVSENGSLIPGAISTAAGEGTVEFLADTPFAPGSTVQVFATTAITDLDGNALNSSTSTFTIRPDPAVETAFVEELRPANGATGVPTNTVLEVRYSEQIDPATVNNLTVRLFPNGLGEQALTVSVVGDGRVIRAEPSGGLSPDRYHNWQVTGVAPLDGGSLNNLSTVFTTGSGDDLDSPTLRSVSPPDGSDGVGVNATVTLRFDEPLNPMSVTTDSLQIAAAGGAPLPRTISFSNGDRILVLTPHAPLTDLTFYDVIIDGVTDLAGNPVTPTTSGFTTLVGPDAKVPDVRTVNPANASTLVSTNTVIEVEFNELIDASSVGAGTIRILRSGLPDAPGVASVASDGRTVVFIPDEPLAVGLQHTIYVQSVKDLTGNVQAFRSYYFTTAFLEDAEPPEVLEIVPEDGLADVPTNAQVTVQFDEPLSPLGLMGGVTVADGNGPVQAVVSLSNGNRRVTVQPLLPLEANTLHTVTIDGVLDRTGNVLSAPVTSDFTTGPGVDLFQPVVSAYSPPHNAGSISTDTVITIEFSERINPVTVNESTLRLRENVQSSFIPGTVTVAPDLMSATFTPDGPLAPYTYHTWYLTYASIKDLTVQALTSTNNNRSFTTGAGDDDVAPQVEVVSPADGATEVPTNAIVKVTIDESLDLLSLENGTLTLSDGAPVDGTFSLSGRTLTFVPAEELGGASSFTVSLSGFSDRAGNVMLPFTSTFSTRTVPAGNLARASQVVLSPSSFLSSSYPPSRAVDGRYDLEWCLGAGDTANSGGSPYYELILPGDATVDEIRFFARTASNGTEIFAGTFELFAADDTPLYASASERIFPPPAPRGWVESVGGVTSVRRVRFNITQDESNNPCMGELEVIGSFDDPTLGQFRDTGKPSPISMTPANGSLDVSVDTDIVVEFNEPVSPVSVNAANLLVRFIDVSGSPRVPGSYEVSGSTVVFTPASPLPNDTRIQVHISASVQDLVGNTSNTASWYLTTGDGADVTGPSVVMVTPDFGATDIGRTTPISIIFDEPLNPSTVTNDTFAIFANGSELSKAIARSADNTVVTLTLTLPAASEIVVTGTDGIRDLSGNPASGFVSVFDTSANLDLSRPTVVTLRPGSGSTRVDAGTQVVLYANDDLDPTSVQTGLYLAQNGALVDGTISTAAGANTMVFTPDAPFEAGAVVQVFATTTIRDADGNALNNYQGSFTIAPDSASENARALDVAPITGATGVPTNVVMEVRYSEPLDPATVNNITVRLFPSGLSEQALNVSLLDAGRLIRAVPTAELSPDRVHSWQVVGVAASDGGGFNAAYYNFTTGAADDLAAPQILSISPPNGSPDVGVNATVKIRFDERVNPLSVNPANTYLEGDEGVVTCAISFISSDRTVVLTPQAPLFGESPYTINVEGITDLAGNLVAVTTSAFDTWVGPDTAAPIVQRFSPANGATGVPISTLVEVEFSEPIDFGTVQTADFRVTPSGQPDVAGAISIGADERTLLFVPDAPLAPSLWHNVQVQNITDRTGNNMTYKAFSFTTGTLADTDAPVVVSASPADGEAEVPTNARLMIEFDETVNRIDLEDQITLTVAGSPVAATISTENARRWVVLRPTVPLAPDTAHTLTIDGVEDRSGNVLATAVEVDFTTDSGPSLVQGRITSHNPITNATDVPTNSVVTLEFNKPVNPITLNTSTFRLRASGTSVDVAGSVTVAGDGRSAIFTPDAPLAASTLHTYTFQYNLVTDLTGATFSSTEWSRNFTTSEAVDTDGPTVELLSPQDQAVDVPVNAYVDILMNEKIDPLSVEGDAVLLLDGATPVPGTASRVGNWQLRFTPSEILRASTTYTVDVDGFTDVAGNAVVPFQGDFTTAGAPDRNLARAFTVELNPISTFSSSYVPTRAVDGSLSTSWFTKDPPFAEDPFFEVILPGDATVEEFRIFGNRQFSSGHDIITADFELFAADDSLLFSSTSVSLPAPDNDAVVIPGAPVTGVRRARFTGTVYDNDDLGISEFELIGDFDDAGLGQFPDTVRPSVALRTPDTNAVDVPVDVIIEVEFNDQINPLTVNATNLPIKISNVQVAGTYAVSGAVVSFTPDEDLPAASTVNVRINSAVLDLAGNQANATNYNFTTE